MNHQFKPGDLALIVDCKVPALIGRVVELIRSVAPSEVFEADTIRWLNRSGCAAWLVSAEGLIRMDPAGALHRCSSTLIAEHKLMPLRGDFQPERQEFREVKA